MTLKPCPCGKVPGRLLVIQVPNESGPLEWRVYGDCCLCWEISFTQTDANAFAEEAWNAAPRGDNGKE